MPDAPIHRLIRSSRLGRAGLLLALLVAPAAAAAQGSEIACPVDTEREVVALVNAERASRGLAPLELDVRLGAASVRHSEDMASGCFLSHRGSDDSSAGERVSDTGYAPWAGEVAGAGYRTPEDIVAGWIGSPGHFDILMKPLATHIGVGHEVRSPCILEGFGFNVSDFWTANLGADTEPPFSEAEYCGPDPEITPACSDGFDNDMDGLVDHPSDPGCRDPMDRTESAPCSDGVDNDEDGLVDYPEDPGCTSPEQFSESTPACGLGFEVSPLLALFMRLRRRRPRA